METDEFIKKYKPKTLNDFIGNRDTLNDLVNWCENEDETDKVCLMFGYTGVGKTLLLEILNRKNPRKYVDLSDKSDSSIQKILAGEKTTLSVIELFYEKHSIPAIVGMMDNFEDKFSIQFIDCMNKHIKKGNKMLISCNVSCKKKITKLKNVKIVTLERILPQELYALVQTVLNREHKRVPENFLSKMYHESNGDVRATLQNLTLVLNKNTKDININRDQNFLIHEFVKTLLKTKDKEIMQNMYGYFETDSYSISYALHENYLDQTKDIDLVCKIADDFSVMDVAETGDLKDFADIMGIVSPSTRLKHQKYKDKKLRPYKIISSSNQRIISKGKIHSAMKKVRPFSTSNSSEESLSIVPLYAQTTKNSKDFRWFFTRFKKGRD